ncbi:hypothetical protein LQ384_26770 [Rhodococcus rhodochrous]|uniref:Uncharacterized protein n=1 Tax=Rhodococcus rhodochrous TaxID=1829 RepID=A0AAW4XN54_RHORH|nr:hypothetical protein [Rhodococcus rhodochrous]MCD2114709.1 hypothetical protein [Rhodococcus rhodochrous]
MRRSIIARALVTAATVGTVGLTGAGLAQATTGGDYVDSGWTESTIDLGVEGQVLMLETGE